MLCPSPSSGIRAQKGDSATAATPAETGPPFCSQKGRICQKEPAMEDVRNGYQGEMENAAPDVKGEEIPVSAAITVRMTKEALYDFFLYHAYSKLSGFLMNILGLAVFFLGVFSFAAGKISAVGCAVFVAASIGFLGYTPFLLSRKAKKAVLEEPVYRDPMEIVFTDRQGMTVRQNETETLYPWERILRASVTPKTIAVYVGPEEAVVIPKPDFGSQFGLCYQIIARNMGMTRSAAAERNAAGRG